MKLIEGKKIIPIGDRILIEPEDAGEFFEGTKIAMAQSTQDSEKQEKARGRVIAVGDGKRNQKDGVLIPMGVMQHDYILYGKWAGTDVEVDGKKLKIIREDDVLARIVDV